MKPMLAMLMLALSLSACDGLGAAVVGPLPEPDPVTGPRSCEVGSCAAYLPDAPQLWTPPSDATAEAACASFTHHMLQGEDALNARTLIESLLVPPQIGEGPLELRCADITIEVPNTSSSFELDLRAITLLGVRILITSELQGRVLLGATGSITATEFAMRGPIDIVANRALIWGAAFSFEHSLHQAPAGSLLAQESEFVRLAITGQGTISLRRSTLSESQIRATRLTTELSSWANTFVRADTVEVFDASIFESHIEAGHFIAAAGRISFSEFVDCIEVILASVRLADSRMGRTEMPVRMSDGFIMNSYIEADLIGSVTITQSALLSQRIDLQTGAVYVSALCGVEFLGIARGVVSCIRCEAGPPEDICVSAHLEPACPGFETAMCSRGERFSTLPEDLMASESSEMGI